MNLTKVFIYLLIFSSCTATRNMNGEKKLHNSPLLGSEAFDKQGHRGCRGLMPENTIPAMLHAIDLGVTTLEMDIVFTKDKKAILSHDPFFNREITSLADGSDLKENDRDNYNIYNMNYADVLNFDVGTKYNAAFPQQQKMKLTKPLLSELIDSVKIYAADHNQPIPFFNIETKTKPETDNKFHPAPEEFVDLLMTIIQEKGIESKTIIQSFDFRTLQYLHKKYPAIQTAMLIEETDRRSFRKQLADLGFTPNIYSPEAGLVTDVLIKNCHDQNIRIIPWTVNEKSKIKEFKNMGVDGIITDYPNLFP